MTLNLSPDPDEIVQSEEDGHKLQPFPTYVCGPVETRELPAVRAGYSTEVGVTTTLGVRLLTLEPRRKTAVIIPTEDIWISSSQAGAASGAAGAVKIPKGLPFEITHMDQVWACAATAPADISVMSVYWSE